MNNFTKFGKTRFNCDYFDGSILKDTRRFILYSFAFDEGPRQGITNGPKIKPHEIINKSFFNLSFSFEEYDGK